MSDGRSEVAVSGGGGPLSDDHDQGISCAVYLSFVPFLNAYLSLLEQSKNEARNDRHISSSRR